MALDFFNLMSCSGERVTSVSSVGFTVTYIYDIDFGD
jgi:hypothetical protein